MKAKQLFLITVLVTVINAFSAKAEEVPIIIVRESTPDSEVLHRAPAQIPMGCSLVDDSYLVVNIFADLGSVSVEIEDQTTGEYNLSTINALVGSELIPISGSAGNWIISFTILGSGVRYIGSFSINR